MGLLSKGTPLSWEQSRRYHDYIKQHGILQFLSIFHATKYRENDVFLWGDEVEHMLLFLDAENNAARISLRAPEILEMLENAVNEPKSEAQALMGGAASSSSSSSAPASSSSSSPASSSSSSPAQPLANGHIHNHDHASSQHHDSSSSSSSSSSSWNAHFVPEYGRFMIEATPALPYGGYTSDLRLVEPNMRLRRALVQRLLRPNEFIVTLTAFPMLGVGRYCEPFHEPYGPIAQSLYISDGIIGPHPRFATLSRNIRIRRGCKVAIRVPLFQDARTAEHVAQQLEARRHVLERVEATRGQSAVQRECERRRAALSSPSFTSIDATPPPITSANNCDADGNELYPPVPDALFVPIDEAHEIHMDAMAFGMGQNCLQVTFQTRGLREARHLYDHLAVFSPIMLALSAATPFQRGRISDLDVRWTVISQAVDDRTPIELGRASAASSSSVSSSSSSSSSDVGMLPLERKASLAEYEASNARANEAAELAVSSLPATLRTPQLIQKSRYDSISTFISLEQDFKPEYNDIPCEIDQASYETLIAAQVDPLLAKHMAHLFIRDPLVIYDESVLLDDARSSDHFENIQSTNWQTVRFKPPPPLSENMGWRVEFRTMEVQLTDFENAAYSVFVALVSRAILYFQLDFYLPLSLVDANLETAHVRDAVLSRKFHWRSRIKSCPQSDCDEESHRIEEMSISEIMSGKEGSGYVGLVPTVRAYLDAIECDAETRAVVDGYLALIEMRANGELMTAATWLRKFVAIHPDYEHNSQLKQSIVADLVRTVSSIQNGTLEVTQLLGKLRGSNVTEAPISPRGVPLRGANSLDLDDQSACCKVFAYLKQQQERYAHTHGHHPRPEKQQ